jgi:hypothetical protein
MRAVVYEGPRKVSVSDVPDARIERPTDEPDDTRTRRTALPHALLSYFFGTVLIATTLNLVTNLAQS